MSAELKDKVLAPVLHESPLALRLFIGPVKTDTHGQIITGSTSYPANGTRIIANGGINSALNSAGYMY
jgi:hypothetical protein